MIARVQRIQPHWDGGNNASGDALEKFKALKKELGVGERAEDGMVMAGFTPSTGKPFFAKPEDELDTSWLLVSLEDPKLRLPDEDELHVMFKRQAIIGGFKEKWYLSGIQGNIASVRTQHFGSEKKAQCGMSIKHCQARLVRS